METAMRFFQGSPESQALCVALLQKLDGALDAYQIRESKTQLSLYSGCMFACISYPKSKKQGKLLVTFGLGSKVLSERIWQSVEAYPGRWTHHVLLNDASQIDDELIGLICAAQSFALNKKKR